MKEFTAELVRDGLWLIEERPYDNAQIWTDGRMDFVLFYDDGGKVIDFSADGIHIEERER